MSKQDNCVNHPSRKAIGELDKYVYSDNFPDRPMISMIADGAYPACQECIDENKQKNRARGILGIALFTAFALVAFILDKMS